MDTKFWISGVVMSVLAFALGFVVHGLLLAGDYTPLAGSVFRTPEDAHSHLLYMVLAYILFGFAFTWIYRHAGASTLGQGVRFGLAINVFDAIAVVLMGIAVAYLNRAPGRRDHQPLSRIHRIVAKVSAQSRGRCRPDP